MLPRRRSKFIGIVIFKYQCVHKFEEMHKTDYKFCVTQYLIITSKRAKKKEEEEKKAAEEAAAVE